MSNPNQVSRGPEKRYIPRWNVQNKILYRKEENNIYREALSKDINSSGACFLCPEAIQPPSKLTLLLYLSEHVAVEVSGTVLWNKDGSGYNLIGIRFESIPRQIQEIILQHAFEYKKEDLVRHWFKGWEEKTPPKKDHPTR